MWTGKEYWGKESIIRRREERKKWRKMNVVSRSEGEVRGGGLRGSE